MAMGCTNVSIGTAEIGHKSEINNLPLVDPELHYLHFIGFYRLGKSQIASFCF